MTGPLLQRRAGVLRALFWLLVVFTGTCAVVPPDLQPHIAHSDKVEHFAAFFVLSVLACLAYGPRRFWRGALGLSLFGGLIEIAQALPLVHRDADVLDWLTDSAAILVVLLVALLATRARRSGATMQGDSG